MTHKLLRDPSFLVILDIDALISHALPKDMRPAVIKLIVAMLEKAQALHHRGKVNGVQQYRPVFFRVPGCINARLEARADCNLHLVIVRLNLPLVVGDAIFLDQLKTGTDRLERITVDVNRLRLVECQNSAAGERKWSGSKLFVDPRTFKAADVTRCDYVGVNNPTAS